MLRIGEAFIIYGGIFSAINFTERRISAFWSQRQQQSAACFMTGDETCMTFIDDAVGNGSRQYGENAQYSSLFVACYYKRYQ